MFRTALVRLFCVLATCQFCGFALGQSQPPKTVLAHYMPWYMARPYSQQWGWHWTMNVFDPEGQRDTPFKIASHYTPLVGPYDSSDPAVLEYHLLTMKLAGIDGVIVDWYGQQDFRDYALLHANTTKLIEVAEQLQMQFAICYEDQTVIALQEAGKIGASDRVLHVHGELQWLQQHWFSKQNYVRLDGRPVLLSFGQNGLSDDEWQQCLGQLSSPVDYFSLHHRRTAARGAFDWPIPSHGTASVDRFYAQALAWTSAIPIAFPRFVDIYAEAKVHDSYGRIEDDGGLRFREQLQRAFRSKYPIVQLATWNDWGEGTQIEPSKEFGFRDLETVQAVRREFAPEDSKATAEDLRLPLELYQLRKDANDASSRLDAIAQLLAKGEYTKARAQLEQAARN